MTRKDLVKLIILAMILAVGVSAVTWRLDPVAVASSMVGSEGPLSPLGPAGEQGGVPDNTPLLVEPVPGGPGFYNRSSFGFIPFTQTDQWARIGGYLYHTSGNGIYVDSLTLPNGATVTQLAAFFYDNDPINDAQFYLGRCPVLGDQYCTQMAVSASSGADPGFRFVVTNSIANPIINNQEYSYITWAYLPASPSQIIGFNGMRVDYLYSAVLPVMNK